MEANENQQQWAIRDYDGLVVNNSYSGIARQTIVANNFELTSGLISMVKISLKDPQ